MNVSFLALRLHSYEASPYFAQKADFLFKKSEFSRFFGSLIRTTHNLHLQEVKAAHFLNTVAVVSSNVDYTGVYIGNSIVHPIGSNATAVNCYFVDCQSNATAGALDVSGLSFIVKSSTFLRCSTLGYQGGAFHSLTLEASIERCCGNSCFASYFGQFFRCFYTENRTDVSHIVNQTSANYCGTDFYENSAETMIICYGTNVFQDCNSSYSTVSGYRSAFALDGTLLSHLKFSVSVSNKGSTTNRIQIQDPLILGCVMKNNTDSLSMIEGYGSIRAINCYFLDKTPVVSTRHDQILCSGCFFALCGFADTSVVLGDSILGVKDPETPFNIFLNTALCPGHDSTRIFSATLLLRRSYLALFTSLSFILN